MTDRPKVVITRKLPGVSAARIAEKAEVVAGGAGPMPRNELLEKVRGASGILCTLADRIDAALLDVAGEGLRVVSNFAVGTDNIDLPEARRRGVRVCNTPDVLTEATADLAFALLLGAARRLPDADRFVREGAFTGWDPWGFLGVPVHGRTLGVVGMGKIGGAVAARGRGFAMRILYHNRRRLPEAREAELGVRYATLEDLLSGSDFVVLTVPRTPETRGMLGRDLLRRMAPDAVLVNVARGGIVDEEALAEGLRERRIFAAGLDVYEKEPEVHPGLLRSPYAVLLPHLGSATKEARRRMGELATENLLAVLEGSAPPSPVS